MWLEMQLCHAYIAVHIQLKSCAQAEAQKAVGRGGIAPPPRHLKRKVSDVHAGQRQDVQLLMPCDSFSSRHSDDWHIAAGAVKPGAAAPQTVHINVFAGAPPADARRPALRGTADESGAQMAELSMTAGSSTAQRSSEPGLASHAGVSLDRRCDSWPRLGRAIGQPDSCPGSRDASPLKARQAAAAKLPSLKQAQTPAKVTHGHCTTLTTLLNCSLCTLATAPLTHYRQIV